MTGDRGLTPLKRLLGQVALETDTSGRQKDGFRYASGVRTSCGGLEIWRREILNSNFCGGAPVPVNEAKNHLHACITHYIF